MDKALQREQTRKRVERYRNRQKGVTVDTEKAGKLLMICNALDKEVTGLDGKGVNLLTMVRYGVEGLTLKGIRDKLS